MAEVGPQRESSKKWSIFRRFWVKEAPSFRKIFRTKSATPVVASVLDARTAALHIVRAIQQISRDMHMITFYLRLMKMVATQLIAVN